MMQVMPVGGPSPEDKKAVADYYRVLNIILECNSIDIFLFTESVPIHV